MYRPGCMTQTFEDDRIWQENRHNNKQPYLSAIGTNYTGPMGTCSASQPIQLNQQYLNSLYHQSNLGSFANPAGNLPFTPQRTESRITYIGEGITVAGQSTEDFARRPRVSLCYQCCKWIPLRTLINTREESCGYNTCRRTREAGLEFIPMPNAAVDACDQFLTFLIWWMDKVDVGVDKAIERRSRHRVREMRDDIPDTASYGY
ncbi:hypothetical protein FHL15_008263 [Xylaria flabelliformis]|uniref:Uncharacterized protein n=1 Tax=Xylaria flabelliformis TaxID=2512241 RepID=A0A553HSC6_9PEZI|nr:hypothetical protein FHL15_008263 [Xylaria flabelliformis]